MNRTIVIGIVGVAVVVGALALNYWFSLEEEPAPGPAPVATTQPAPQSPAAGPEASPPAEPRTVDVPPAPTPKTAPATPGQEPPADTVPAASQDTAGPAPAEGAPEEAAAAAPIVPEFDVVRVAPTGDVVVAGRAAPGAVVTVYDSGRPIGQVRADARGEWVLLPDEPLSPGSRELSLSSRLGDAEPVWSGKVVVMVVPEAGRDVAGRPSEETAGALAVEVPRSGFDTSEVLQQPPAADAPPLPTDGQIALSVDVVDYDERGNLGLSGRAGPNDDVLIYLDNELLGSAPVGADGGWRLLMERAIAPGLYALRVDEMAGKTVVARLEFPFERADPQEIDTGAQMVVVQPGNSLWRLARRTLGEGARYTVIYQANKDRIRDPNLIYPGQVFEIPRTN